MRKTIILICLGAMALFSDSSIYNCVDCSYNSVPNAGAPNMSSRGTVIVYEEPRSVKVFIQNYSCPQCGLFEVSVREKVKTEVIRK